MTTEVTSTTAPEAVKPKRKYTSTKNVERNAEIVRLFTKEGNTLRMIAEKYGVTHQAISQTLQKQGVDPGAVLAARNAEKSAVTVQAQLEKRQARQAARQAGVQKISELWKSGAKVEDIRVACGLKSVGATNVKIVLLRRKFPDLFPLRHKRKVEAPAPV
jgi:phosphate starvation-inducible protein PhoH